MKKVVGAAVALVVVLGIAGVVWLRTSGSSSAASQPAAKTAAAAAPKATPAATVKSAATSTVTTTYEVQAGGRQRAYEAIDPSAKALPATAPIIVFLAGVASPTESGAQVVLGEEGRDYLMPYAASGEAEVVYPEPLYGSWNATGCCGKAATEKVNDMAFLAAVVADVDPGHTRQIDLVGYSNGARLAYRAVCDEPGLFDQYAMVKGEPMPGCDVKTPTTILQLASANDPEVPYKPGDRGSVESLPTTTLVSELHATDKCSSASTSYTAQQMTQVTWSGCADGTRLALATWTVGEHNFPRPPQMLPAASQVIWAFFTRSKLASLPQ